MQQFTVPQFIDVEPKIIGPITVRQFLIMLAAALFIFVAYRIFDFTGFVIVSVIIFLIAMLFSFIKINGRPFHFFVLNIIQAIKRPGLRIWDHKSVALEKEEIKELKYEKIIPVDKYFDAEELARLSLIADTKGRYRGDDEDSIKLEDEYN